MFELGWPQVWQHLSVWAATDKIKVVYNLLQTKYSPAIIESAYLFMYYSLLRIVDANLFNLLGLTKEQRKPDQS